MCPQPWSRERRAWTLTEADGPKTKAEKPGTPTTGKCDSPDGWVSSRSMATWSERTEASESRIESVPGYFSLRFHRWRNREWTTLFTNQCAEEAALVSFGGSLWTHRLRSGSHCRTIFCATSAESPRRSTSRCVGWSPDWSATPWKLVLKRRWIARLLSWDADHWLWRMAIGAKRQVSVLSSGSRKPCLLTDRLPKHVLL